jgi:hypothetical protein
VARGNILQPDSPEEIDDGSDDDDDDDDDDDLHDDGDDDESVFSGGITGGIYRGTTGYTNIKGSSSINASNIASNNASSNASSNIASSNIASSKIASSNIASSNIASSNIASSNIASSNIVSSNASSNASSYACSGGNISGNSSSRNANSASSSSINANGGRGGSGGSDGTARGIGTDSPGQQHSTVRAKRKGPLSALVNSPATAATAYSVPGTVGDVAVAKSRRRILVANTPGGDDDDDDAVTASASSSTGTTGSVGSITGSTGSTGSTGNIGSSSTGTSSTSSSTSSTSTGGGNASEASCEAEVPLVSDDLYYALQRYKAGLLTHHDMMSHLRRFFGNFSPKLTSAQLVAFFRQWILPNVDVPEVYCFPFAEYCLRFRRKRLDVWDCLATVGLLGETGTALEALPRRAPLTFFDALVQGSLATHLCPSYCVGDTYLSGLTAYDVEANEWTGFWCCRVLRIGWPLDQDYYRQAIAAKNFFLVEAVMRLSHYLH